MSLYAQFRSVYVAQCPVVQTRSAAVASARAGFCRATIRSEAATRDKGDIFGQ
jgi:hypothetical protein